MTALIELILLLLFLWFLYIRLPIKMAKSRCRGTVEWIIIFWITSPIVGAILLAIVGNNPNKIKGQ
jgi:hypothetical protein